MFQIFDNIIDKKEQTELLNYFLDPGFPYYFSSGDLNSVDNKTFKENKDLNTQECKLLVHLFYTEGKIISTAYNIVEKLLHKFINKTNLNYSTIFRAKLNLQFKEENYNTEKYMTPHIDNLNNHKVLIYYPIDADGKTFLFKKDNEKYIIIDQVKPKQGRFILFDGNTYHAGQPPIKSDFRLTLNFNII
jgi:hypothetical protein